ncbi:GntR family transcriptional regulator [Sphingomonas histidinilytica]|jgi:DNA-binding GntR family transcriptional regulator|uniref:GntR family transcriptional regulator n=1 Tax=Rhizorhabdus histidinilytica TaxID=439228 RepID=UPI001ADB83FE|nr:GntR family transcriptional regulator [Rhizorhabdus histidinilytica]MBO9378116.1 GntR family transcriptional regulator [Rhizorhabdus histidinilytica]
MSPAYVLEPTYDTLRRRLLAGVWPSGQRLEAARLAKELGVSMTPVRDSLNRLAGERLVHASHGEGYQVPLLDETELRALIDWHEALIGIALGRRSAMAVATELPEGHDGIGERTAIIFAVIANTAGSLELHWALGNAAARLGCYRRHEETVLDQALAELAALEALMREGNRAKLARAIERYHDRRRAVAGDLVHAARHADSPDV